MFLVCLSTTSTFKLCFEDTELQLNDKISRVAGEHGLNGNVVDVPADGNCGLHAVVDQLSAQGVVVEAAALRAQAVCFILEAPSTVNG